LRLRPGRATLHGQKEKVLNSMNKFLKTFAFASSLGLATALFSGCAGTAYKESTGEYIDSAAITTKVKTALMDDSEIKGLKIDVDTFKGVVELKGTVDTAAMKQRAEQIVWGVEGVRAVKNELKVKYPTAQTSSNP